MPLENRDAKTIYKTVVIRLLYPATLGAIVYQFFWQIFYVSPIPSSISLLATLAVILHYLMDYTYTAISASTNQNTTEYKGLTALCDFLIICSLFIAANSVWNPRFITIEWLLPAMAFTKVCTLGWDRSAYGRFLRCGWDFFFLALYSVSGITFIYRFYILSSVETYLYVASISITIDTLGYAVYIFRERELVAILVDSLRSLWRLVCKRSSKTPH